MPNALRIENLSLLAKLGVSAEERAVRQEIRIHAELRFLEAPHATHSDRIGDTVCYGRLCEAFSELCAEREFHLIEHLAAECLALLRRIAEGRAEVAVAVHKVNPPVPGLLGGAVFRLGDFLP